MVKGYNYQRNIEFFSLKIVFVLKYSVDSDEMPQYAAFHLGLHCLTQYPFWGIWYSKGQIILCLCVFLYLTGIRWLKNVTNRLYRFT